MIFFSHNKLDEKHFKKGYLTLVRTQCTKHHFSNKKKITCGLETEHIFLYFRYKFFGKILLTLSRANYTAAKNLEKF